MTPSPEEPDLRVSTVGFDCMSCAWPDPEHRHRAEFCENGRRGHRVDLAGQRDSSGDWVSSGGVRHTRGTAAVYYPETNPLVPLGSTAEGSNTPTSKSSTGETLADRSGSRRERTFWCGSGLGLILACPKLAKS